MSLWEAFCEKFGGTRIERFGMTEIPDEMDLRIFTLKITVDRDTFERGQEEFVDDVERYFNSRIKAATDQMRSEIKRLRSQGPKNEV